MGSTLKHLDSAAVAEAAKRLAPIGDGALGGAFADFAANGWPMETIEKMIAEGSRRGNGEEGWKEVALETGERLAISKLSLGGAAAPALIAINRDTGEVAAKIGGEFFEGSTAKDAAEKIAKKTKAIGSQLREINNDANEVGGFQKEALELLQSGQRQAFAQFRPKIGEDALDAWERDFDRIDSTFGGDPKAMDRIRGQYQGLGESEALDWAKEQLLKGKEIETPSGTKAKALAFGGLGADLSALAPLREDGSIDPETPIVAVLDDGTKKESLRFYSMEGLARFAAGMTKTELGSAPESSPKPVGLAGFRDRASQAAGGHKPSHAALR